MDSYVAELQSMCLTDFVIVTPLIYPRASILTENPTNGDTHVTFCHYCVNVIKSIGHNFTFPT